MKIPIGRVGEIGLAAMGGAELGALGLATYAAYAGGAELIATGSLSEAAAAARARISIPSIISYVGGSAVGSGTSQALGGGTTADIIAGLASGVVSRQALKKYNQIKQHTNKK